ncbi:MAG TPA: RES family NAD+ phosphorylase [Devosia sp.]|nr:RES family NAD+ phosphorylase [Devosia sp.]
MSRASFDPKIYDLLETLQPKAFAGEVFRAVPEGANPLTFSSGGGRWGLPSRDPSATSILYTSKTFDGALAEVSSYYKLLTPLPSKPLVVHRIGIVLQRVLTLDMSLIARLDVDEDAYSGRPYLDPPSRTQEIGATVSFLGFDGLQAPSARFATDNLMIMGDNFAFDGRLEVLEAKSVDWQSWADANLRG